MNAEEKLRILIPMIRDESTLTSMLEDTVNVVLALVVQVIVNRMSSGEDYDPSVCLNFYHEFMESIDQAVKLNIKAAAEQFDKENPFYPDPNKEVANEILRQLDSGSD